MMIEKMMLPEKRHAGDLAAFLNNKILLFN